MPHFPYLVLVSLHTGTTGPIDAAAMDAKFANCLTIQRPLEVRGRYFESPVRVQSATDKAAKFAYERGEIS